VRILALDYGTERTGVAVCDPTETIVRPCGVVHRAMTEEGLREVAAAVVAREAELVVVGVPVSLAGGEHAQARLARDFAERLAAAVTVPVETYDERYTTKLAEARGGRAALDARAAAVLLEDYLRARAADTR
jgi:putative Holliday junction resolvase